MKATIAILAGAYGLVSLLVLATSTATLAQTAANFAAPGRIEGATPTIRMGFPIMGIVKEVAAKPATRVVKGTILASLICDDRAANISVAEAELNGSRAALAKLKQGSRDEERKIAAALTNAAESDVLGSKNIAARYEALRVRGGAGGVITELQVDTVSDQLKSAQARHGVAVAQSALVTSPARREDIASAEAQLAGMNAKLTLAKAEAEKCLLRAPIDTTILKVAIERGDVVAITPPQLAITLSDLSRLRVRAEVDERFVDRIKIGQPVTVTSDFNPKLRLPGKVVAREAQMGRRTVLGIDPADKNDRDVLEVVVDLEKAAGESGSALPVGYRVTVLF